MIKPIDDNCILFDIYRPHSQVYPQRSLNFKELGKESILELHDKIIA